MSNFKLFMTVGMNRSILSSLTKGGSATLKKTKHQVFVPSETVKATLSNGEKVDVEIGGYYRDVDVEFKFIRDKSRGGSGRR